MRKFYLAVAVMASLFALSAVAEAAGRTPGAAFTPPGWSHNTTGQTHAGWGTNNTTGVQPPGWSHNSTGQINGGWDGSIAGSGGVPRGLGSH